jgi:hypothetical protein
MAFMVKVTVNLTKLHKIKPFEVDREDVGGGWRIFPSFIRKC